jgi:D-alanine-D-alanine ligase-like ATP-grasp enzyme
MTPKSLLPEIAAEAGISYDELAQWMVEEAACDS